MIKITAARIHLLRSEHEDKHAYNAARRVKIVDALVLCLSLRAWWAQT